MAEHVAGMARHGALTFQHRAKPQRQRARPVIFMRDVADERAKPPRGREAARRKRRLPREMPLPSKPS
jgi:hypothetical protein